MWRHRARVRVHAPASRIVARVPPAVIVEEIDEHACFANVGSDSAHDLAMWLALLDADFDAGHDAELARELRRLGERLTAPAPPPCAPMHPLAERLVPRRSGRVVLAAPSRAPEHESLARF